MTHEEKIAQWIGAGKIGTEIGPGSSPVPGLEPRPIYLDCFTAFGSMPCFADFYGHACALPFHDNSLDYVVASHVLEHVANPVAALSEWYRVLRPGGIIYLLVPDRRVTWDRQRALTSVGHMLGDYIAGTTAADATHIDEFINDVNWAEWCPYIAAGEVEEKKKEVAQILHATVARGEEINLHFHTFEPSNLRELLETLTVGAVPASGRAETSRRPASDDSALRSPGNGAGAQPSLPRFNWELLDFAERFPAGNPNGLLAILRVNKGWRARADADAFQLRNQGNQRAALRDDAVPFAEWAATTTGLGGVQQSANPLAGARPGIIACG